MGNYVFICVGFQDISETDVIKIEQELGETLSPKDTLDCFLVVNIIQIGLAIEGEHVSVFKKIGDITSQHPNKIKVFVNTGPMYAGAM